MSINGEEKNKNMKKNKGFTEKIKWLKKDKNSLVLTITASGVTLLLICSMFMQFKSVDQSKKAGIESLREDELKTQIATYKAKYEETTEQYEENQNKIKEYTDTINENKESSKLVDNELEQANTLLGLTEVTGEGVIITLTDKGEAKYTSENLRYLVNELKYAGAEAISINGNRVINLTDIVTINDSFIVMYGGNVRITSPYEVKAIGDRKYLTSTLNMKNSGFVDLMKSNMQEIKVEESNNIRIEKYTREIESKYMEEVE